ncbi:protein rep, partial [Salmonella enterica subsp. enterica serovar Kentucky]|nr:protein rep [Salmonella enterica subsp. enterica serovar Kentucky]
MKDRKEFKPVQGWIRTTEVTRGRDGSAHPHFHTLMMVPPSM